MKRDFSSLHGREFELLVCGGGIYGAWAAYDAALRGLSVAIVEQGDWASATSSASSKLIHGGLRYLETYDFKLVRKALHERQMLLDAAPHRVWPLRFGVPVYEGSRIGTLQMRAGLGLYDFLAGNVSQDFSHRHFSRDEFAGRFPFLAADNLKGGFTYTDAQTDDARLVLELVAGAAAAGAVCASYCRLDEWIEEGGRACGAVVRDQITGCSTEIRARQIVNAAGQWAAASEQGRKWCRLSKGVHLVMAGEVAEEALLLTAQSDGRVFFIIPWYGMTLLGTTDKDYDGDPNHVRVEPDDVAYLLGAANHYLETPWTEKDVAGSFAGLRVLKRSNDASPSAVSRDWEMETASNGVHYSIGGKLTSAREDAGRIVDAVCAQLGSNVPCLTRGKKFPWAPEASYASWLNAALARATELGVDPASAKWLLRRHGKRAGEILCNIESDRRLAERIIPALPLIHGDLLFCARNEMVVHMDDLLRRRMPLLILAKVDENLLRRIAASVAPALGWDDAEMDREVRSCLAQVQEKKR
ncbi:MAG: glycerol-3-phosphate dehydrogenase/oxidase [Nitrosomonadales bacterium]|nr:glycerol-3-phosphate dehydrogenase/oxidase [Nitrosomonadales bacterium]